jgi:hypothetical protein
MQIGNTIGRWTLIYRGANGIWLCRCQCLTMAEVPERHLTPALGHLRLQQVKSMDLKRYYNESSLSPNRPSLQRRWSSITP